MRKPIFLISTGLSVGCLSLALVSIAAASHAETSDSTPPLQLSNSVVSADAIVLTDQVAPSDRLSNDGNEAESLIPSTGLDSGDRSVQTPAVQVPAPQTPTAQTVPVAAETHGVGTMPDSAPRTSQPAIANSPDLDLDPQLLQTSPTLQRWLRGIPNVQHDIDHIPSFRTRLRLGYAHFPSTDQAGGWNAGIEDVFIGQTGFTLSADYQTTFEGDRSAWGADLRYYLRPLGKSINIAPVVGYRHLETSRYSVDGVNLGLRLLLVLSRGGAADLSLTQSWVAPTTSEEVGLTTLSFGYALTRHWRLSTDIQKQNAKQRKDSRVGIVLEWMF